MAASSDFPQADNVTAKTAAIKSENFMAIS
jgi:hypothetical protein